MTALSYLLQGDSLYIREKTAALIHKLGDPNELEVETVTLAESELGDFLSKARTKPFFAAMQVFIFSDAEELTAADLDLLETYLSGAPAYSALFFQWNEDGKEPYAKASEASKRLADIIKKAGGIVEVSASRDNLSSVQAFIRAKLKNSGKALAPQALKTLEQLGQDFPSLLDTAVENLILSAGESSEISLEMVEAFDEDRGRGNRFRLLDALLARRSDEALRIFSRLIDSGDDDPIMLMAFLHGQFKLFWQAQLLVSRGYPDSRVFSEIKLNPKRAVFFARQMRSYSRFELERALELLFELDRSVKIGEEEVRAGLEKWIARTTGFKSAVRAI